MNSQQTTDLFKGRFDVSQIHDFDAVSDAVLMMVNRAENTLFLITELLESTERGGGCEIGAIYGAIEELHDIEELTRLYRQSLRKPKTTPNNETGADCGAITNEMIANRVREIATMIENGD